jgi:ligand-binding sensor protein
MAFNSRPTQQHQKDTKSSDKKSKSDDGNAGPQPCEQRSFCGKIDSRIRLLIHDRLSETLRVGQIQLR